MGADLEHHEAHIRGCMVVFGCLLVLTVITVLASYLHLPTSAAIVVALCIASVKGSMVSLYFMHLISEKKLIYLSLGFTLFFSIVLLILPVASKLNPIRHLFERSF